MRPATESGGENQGPGLTGIVKPDNVANYLGHNKMQNRNKKLGWASLGFNEPHVAQETQGVTPVLPNSTRLPTPPQESYSSDIMP